MKQAGAPMRKGRPSTVHNRRSGACGPRLRWVLVSVSLAVVCVCVIMFLVMAVPRVHLNDYVLPNKNLYAHSLKLTTKLKWSKTCDGFGVRQDMYFSKYGGKACGQSEWAVNRQKAAADFPLSRAHLVYKIFNSNSSAHDYYEKFWGRHLYERLPPYLYTDVDKAISERVGDERKAYYWHPKSVPSGMPVPFQATRVPVHVIFLFRQGPAFVRVITDGYFAGTDDRKLVQIASSISYDSARHVRRAMHKFTPMQQQFYDVQSQTQRVVFGGWLKVKATIYSAWTLYWRRLRNRLRKISALFSTHLFSVQGGLSVASSVFSEVVGSKIEFWLVAIVILMLQPIQCSMTLRLSKAAQSQLFCKSCMRIHTRGHKTAQVLLT